MEIIRMINDVGSGLNRFIQQAEEMIFDVEKTDFEKEYILNVKKLNVLLHLTETLIDETESMLEPNPAYRLEGKFMEKVDIRNDRNTPLEDLGIAFDNAAHDVKQYNYELYKDFYLCAKYQTKLGTAAKEFQNNASDIYVSKLRRMLNIDLRKYKDEEEILENLRLDYDSLKIRITKAFTLAGKKALEKEFDIVNEAFLKQLDVNIGMFQSIDSFFEVHRQLLREFIEAQAKYYMDCHNDLDKFKSKIERRSLSSFTQKRSGIYQDITKEEDYYDNRDLK